MSLQQQLADAIRKAYDDAVVKKVDVDNYVDIHLPSVHSKRGTHLFFNTARGTIKVGFYCRDEEFIASALAKSGLLEPYSQGVRPTGNPTFSDTAKAIRAALDMLTLLGQPIRDVRGESEEEDTEAISAIGHIDLSQYEEKLAPEGDDEDDEAEYGDDDEEMADVTGPASATEVLTAAKDHLVSQFLSMISGRKQPAVPTLISAVKRGDVQSVLNLLHNYDVDLEQTDDVEGLRALHYAAWDGRVEIVEALLEKGANPNALDNDGFTPLNLAVLSGHLGCVRLLLDHGANIDQRTKRPNGYHGRGGGTALRDAVINQYWEIIDLLIARGGDTSVLLEPCVGVPRIAADLFDAVAQAGAREPSLRVRFNAARLAELKTACTRGLRPTAKGSGSVRRLGEVPANAVIEGPKLPKLWLQGIHEGSSQLKRTGAKGLAAITDEYQGGKVAARLPNRTLSKDVAEKLCARIRSDRVIPIFVPAEVQKHCEPFHKWSKVWWFLPGVILRNGMSGPMCLEMQGLSILTPEGAFQLGVDFDAITEFPDTYPLEFALKSTEIKNPKWREWTLEYEEDAGDITLFEYQGDPNAGFHLDIVKAICDVWWPVVERSRDSSVIVHQPDDPTMRGFDSLHAIAAWALGGD